VPISGNESLNFHPVNLGIDTLRTTERGASEPDNPPLDVVPAVTTTFAPFHVTDFRVDGPTIVKGTVVFKSPVSASRVPTMLALRTRYGPPTKTVELLPILQKFAKGPLPAMTGDQKVAAVT
jgi:hypothetical protein